MQSVELTIMTAVPGGCLVPICIGQTIVAYASDTRGEIVDEDIDSDTGFSSSFHGLGSLRLCEPILRVRVSRS